MLKRFRKTQKGFSLVELMIVVAILGVLAAIAIPAFVRYLNSSKAAEATTILSRVSAGAKAYFEADQQYGVHSWHPAGTGNTASGYPVPGGSKTFPNGTTSFSTHDAPPSGGSKSIPDNAIAGDFANALRVDLTDPLYFMYEYGPTGRGSSAELTLAACHNFKGGTASDCGADIHTVQATCTVNDTGVVVCPPFFVTHEFE